ncbi:MAG TPA: M23 family metallopeptidase [Candidatus Babeliales bacterium]|nr:M23 family metallopeptidase [Candidatus Babeliales bacterium]
MIGKRFSFICSILFAFFATIIIFLMILLFIEYRFFCKQVQELLVIKKQYVQYIDLLHKKINNGSLDNNHCEQSLLQLPTTSHDMTNTINQELSLTFDQIMAAEASDDPDDDDDYDDESFVVINRQQDYLKQSTLDYIESQNITSLATIDNTNQWTDKSEQKTIIECSQKQNIHTPTKQKQKVDTVRCAVKDHEFIWPIDENKFWLSSLFGPRKRINGTWGFHHGIDMAAIKGTTVKAVGTGTITEASFQTGYGNTVVVKHNEMIRTRYAHLHTIRVHAGQKIKQGSIIGTVGETGFIRKKGKDGSHLHFEVYERGKRINPLHCLPRTA